VHFFGTVYVTYEYTQAGKYCKVLVTDKKINVKKEFVDIAF